MSARQSLAEARADLDRRADAMTRAVAAFEKQRALVRRLENGEPAEPRALRDNPKDPTAGMIPLSAAAERAHRSVDAVRLWALQDGIGRKIKGRWWIDPHLLHQLIVS
jgi:hypothetical protein